MISHTSTTLGSSFSTLRKGHIFNFHGLPLDMYDPETVFYGDNFNSLPGVQNAFDNFNGTPVKNDLTLVHIIHLQFRSVKSFR